MTAIADLTQVITAAARGAGRSLQDSIGPSEIGGACERRLAMTLIGAPKVNDARDEWTSSVGTAVHAWLEKAFMADNARRDAAGLPMRWLVEQTVQIRTGLEGHCDLYDLETHSVIDHKVPGVTSIRKARKAGNPGQQYRWQAHLYGLGWANAGLPVETVQLVMWPRSGLLADAWAWSEPWDPGVAHAALGRVDTLLEGMNVADHVGRLGDFLDVLDRDVEHCGWCAYFNKFATDPTEGCRGPFSEKGYVDPKTQAVAGII